MDTRIANTARPDIMMIESTARPTPAPSRVSFGQVLAAGVNGLVQGAEIAASKLPGSPITAAAVRGGPTNTAPFAGSVLASAGTVGAGVSPEGPLATAAPLGGAPGTVGAVAANAITGATDPAGGIDASLQQSAQLNMYYLQLQEQVDAQNRNFTTLSNVLKAEHDTAKSAIGNIHS
ncbi:MAG: hypothetical protein JOZ69_19275 [Myxococcales bacterium]|nr:hypothetical protein [Myxococcales bacterium]